MRWRLRSSELFGCFRYPLPILWRAWRPRARYCRAEASTRWSQESLVCFSGARHAGSSKDHRWSFRKHRANACRAGAFPVFSTPDNIGQWISYEGLENYSQAKQEGRGVLIATAHLGNWELSAFAHALMTEPMNVMVRALDNPLIDRIVEARRTLSGNRLIYKKEAVRSVLMASKKQ